MGCGRHTAFYPEIKMKIVLQETEKFLTFQKASVLLASTTRCNRDSTCYKNYS